MRIIVLAGSGKLIFQKIENSSQKSFSDAKILNMMNFNVFATLSVAFLASLTSASYAGPFLFWGMDGLNDMKVPSLQGEKKNLKIHEIDLTYDLSIAIDDKALRDIYSGASSIVIFVRNSTTKLNHENFPKLSEIVNTSEWLYLPQKTLSSDPIEYNPNAEVNSFLTAKNIF